MDSRIYSAAVTILIATTPAVAQTTTNPGATNTTTSPSTSNPGDTTTPSSSTTGQSATGSSETPVNVSPSPVEQNRLDPSAPSPQRLLIDPGTAAGGTGTNPAENSSDPNAPGNSYNAIIEGTNNGTSTGTSGLGVTPAPSPLSPSLYPQRLTIPPTQNPASNYPAPLTAPVFTQPTAGPGIGTPAAASSMGTHSSLQSHAFSHSAMPGSHAHAGGGHR